MKFFLLSEKDLQEVVNPWHETYGFIIDQVNKKGKLVEADNLEEARSKLCPLNKKDENEK